MMEKNGRWWGALGDSGPLRMYRYYLLSMLHELVLLGSTAKYLQYLNYLR